MSFISRNNFVTLEDIDLETNLIVVLVLKSLKEIVEQTYINEMKYRKED